MQSQSARTQTRTNNSDQVILHLRSTPDSEQAAQRTENIESRPRVRWTTDVVDNENMNKKKSKICCIFHPQREFGESSDEEGCGSSESSDSSDDSDASDVENGNNANNVNNSNGTNNGDNLLDSQSGGTAEGDSSEPCCHHKKRRKKKKDSTHKHKKPATPNAYERQPQYKNRSTLPQNPI